jgi:predicted MFS family arabinose efflux permease
VPVGRLVVLRTTEKSDLMRAIAILTWPALTAPILGPPLGGFITEALNWRWCFYLNLPLGIAGILVALRLIPAGRDAEQRPFDWLGFLLGAAACLTLTLTLELMGREDLSWPTVGGFAVATIVLCAALYRHIRTAKHPLVGLQPFETPSFKFALLGGSAMRVFISTMPFMLPLLFQLGFGLDPFHSGLLVLTLFIGNIGIKPLTSPILRRWTFRSVMVTNGLIQAVCMAGCSMLTPAVPDIVIIPLLVVAGASRSLQFTALNTLAFAEVPKQWTGMANTMFSLAFQFSIGMGVAIGAVALRATGTSGLPAFHGAFAAIAVMMALASLTGLTIARDAASVVAGRG